MKNTQIHAILLVTSFLFSTLVIFNGFHSNPIRLGAPRMHSVPVQGGTVLFDESHSPMYGDTLDLNLLNFSLDLQSQGYSVQNMSVWSWSLLMAADVLVVGPHSTSFSATEYQHLHEFVANGGGLLIIGNGGTTGDWDELASFFDVTWSGYPLSDLDDYQTNTYWINWTDMSNFGAHPITTGVSSAETYYGGGFNLFPPDATPILISDADDNSEWYSGMGVASGIPAIVAFEYLYGLGRVVVHGDVSSFESNDYDTDGTICYFDEDNEILARNIIDWLAHPDIPEKIIVFDESHGTLDAVTFPVSPVDVLFDESHSPFNTIDDNDNGIYGYEEDGSPYGDFAQIIEGAGFTVSKMNTWSDPTVAANDVIVLVNPATLYSTNELNTIRDHVRYGGSLLLIGDGNAVYGQPFPQIARLFGADIYDGALNDTDDYYTTETWIRFTNENLANHPVLNGVNEVILLWSTGFNQTPTDSFSFINTDNDATSNWVPSYIPPGETNPALNIPTAIGFPYGMGRVAMIGDLSQWHNSTGNNFLPLVNNALFGINLMRWLGEGTYNYGDYYTAVKRLQEAGYGIKVMFNFNASFLIGTDALILPTPQSSYSVAERNIIKDYVETQGHGLLVTGEFPPLLGSAQEIAMEFGLKYEDNAPAVLEDTDENSGNYLTQILFSPNNIGTHPILTGITDCIYLAGTGFSVLPGGTDILIRMDNDATAQWSNGSAAQLIPTMVALEPNRGRMVAIGDGDLWSNYLMDAPNVGDNKTIYLDLLDNYPLWMNTIDWLTANRPPVIHVDAPNGGEILNGTIIISWTSDDFDDDMLTFDVLITFDNGSSWTTLVDDLTNTSIQWNSYLGPNSELCRIRIIADDGIATSEDVSDDVFAISNPIITPPLPWWWWIVVLILVIIVIVILIYLFLRRRGAKVD
ncbi:MAG: DUF4350 domain-containing protein [Promethearchaeota archaeon]